MDKIIDFIKENALIIAGAVAVYFFVIKKK